MTQTVQNPNGGVIEILPCPTPHCSHKKPPRLHKLDSRKLIPISKARVSCSNCGYSLPWTPTFEDNTTSNYLAVIAWNTFGRPQDDPVIKRIQLQMEATQASKRAQLYELRDD